MPSPRAVIWDCDGVLIDSEAIVCRVAIEALNAAGAAFTLEQYVSIFVGTAADAKIETIELVEGLIGVRLTMELLDRIDQLELDALYREVVAIPGVAAVLEGLRVPTCVASGSRFARVERTLAVADLIHHFDGRIYSSAGLCPGKPAPDIFLYAAAQLGVAPEGCLVVEDSVHGIQAAKAAGMPVVAFTGASHMLPVIIERVLATRPDHVVSTMPELAALLAD